MGAHRTRGGQRHDRHLHVRRLCHARRLRLLRQQRLVLGANTFRDFLYFLGPDSDDPLVDDPINKRMKNMPTTVVSTTLQGPLDWPDATLASGDAVDIVT